MSETPPVAAMQARVLIPFAIITLIWGSTWLVIRDQLETVPSSWSVAYRFLIAGIAMLVVALVRREKLMLDRPGLIFALAMAVSQFVLNFNLVYQAEHYITSGLVAVVFALLIIPNAVLGKFILGQDVSPRFMVGSVIAVVGVALLFVHEIRADGSGGLGVLLGIGLSLLAVMSASSANILQATQTSRRYPMATMLAWSMLMGAGIDAMLAWTVAGPPVFDWRWGYVAGLFYLGVFASAVAFSLYYGIVRIIGPAKAAYSSVLVPVIAMLLSTVFESYRWSTLAIAGGVLAIAGLVVALRARRPAR